MVACAFYYYTFIIGSAYIFFSVFSGSTVYLYFILIYLKSHLLGCPLTASPRWNKGQYRISNDYLVLPLLALVQDDLDLHPTFVRIQERLRNGRDKADLL